MEDVRAGTNIGVADYAPNLAVSETSDGVRLDLVAITSAKGSNLQDAADELVRKLLVVVMAARAGELCGRPGLRPDPRLVDYLRRLGAIAAEGGDIRDVVFGETDIDR